MKEQATIYRLLELRPKHVPDGWIIFNAPRPIIGSILDGKPMAWTGDCRHGVFFTAVNPKDDKARIWIENNIDLDAFICEYITIDFIREWAKSDEYYQSALNHLGDEVDKEFTDWYMREHRYQSVNSIEFLNSVFQKAHEGQQAFLLITTERQIIERTIIVYAENRDAVFKRYAEEGGVDDEDVFVYDEDSGDWEIIDHEIIPAEDRHIQHVTDIRKTNSTNKEEGK